MREYKRPEGNTDREREKCQEMIMSKHGGAGGRFGDYLFVDCANLPCISGRNQFINTKFTKHNTKISKSRNEREREGEVKAAAVMLAVICSFVLELRFNGMMRLQERVLLILLHR